MRAVRFDGQRLTLVELGEPEPGPGEALVKVTRVGLSPLDGAVRAPGAHRGATGVVGHQFCGVVKRINLPSDATPALAARRTLLNQRVAGSPTISCAACDLCRSGLPQHCRSRRVLGLLSDGDGRGGGGGGQDGVCAELIRVPLLNLYAVPKSVSDEQAALAFSVGCALHVAHLLRAEGKTYITVLGDTALALLTAQALMRLNKSVRLLGERDDRGALCDKWGIKHRPMHEAGRRQDQDVVVDCTGTTAGLRAAIQLVRPRGMVVLNSPLSALSFPAGRPLPDGSAGAGFDLTPIASNELQVVGCREGSVPDALGLLSEGAIDVGPLIARRVKLADAPAVAGESGIDELFTIVELG